MVGALEHDCRTVESVWQTGTTAVPQLGRDMVNTAVVLEASVVVALLLELGSDTVLPAAER